MNKILLGTISLLSSVTLSSSTIQDKPLYCFSYEKNITTIIEDSNSLISKTNYYSIFVCDEYYYEEIPLNLEETFPNNNYEDTIGIWSVVFKFSIVDKYTDYNSRVEIYYNVYNVL